MALDFLKLHDPKLVEAYRAKPAKDATPGLRKKVMNGLKKAMDALAGNKPKHKWYGYDEAGNSVAQVRLGNTPLEINGVSEFGVPREQLANFYTQVGRACEAGELDEAIRAAHASTQSGAPTAQRAPRNAGTGQKRIMSPEHKEKIAAARRGFKSADGTVDLAAYRKWVEAGSDTSKLPK